jgi:hypothetical protein
MTYEELIKIPFHFVSHLSLENEHQSVYADDSGRLGFCDITKKKGFEFGKLAHVVVTRREIIETVELEKDYRE